MSGATKRILETEQWREQVLLETARRAQDPFSLAFLANREQFSGDWYQPTRISPEIVTRLKRTAPAAVELNDRRCREAIEVLREDLASLAVLPTLANLVFIALQRRHQSRLEGGDDILEPELELLAGLSLAPISQGTTRRLPTAIDIRKVMTRALQIHAFAELAEHARLLRDVATPEARIVAAVRSTYRTIRGTTYRRHSDDLAKKLFGGGNRHWFYTQLGFDIEDVIAVRDASRTRWQWLIPALWDAVWNDMGKPLGEDARHTFNDLVAARLWDAMSIRLDRLEEDLPGVGAERARRVVNELACDLRDSWAFEHVYDESPVVSRPWVRSGETALLVLPDRLDTELVTLFEKGLKSRMSGFSKRRADTVDEVTVGLLSSVLPGAAHYVRAHYEPVEAKDRSEPDIDGLLLYDEVAIVVESKAVQLSLPARRGDPRRFLSDLKPITTAWHQAERDVRFLFHQEEVEVRCDKERIRLSTAGIRRCYVVIPTLHPLASWTFQLRDLIRWGVLPAGVCPWIVSVTDLRIVTDAIRQPAELIAFLEWRASALGDPRLVFPDDIELFGSYLWGFDFTAVPEEEATTATVVGMQSDFDAYHEKLLLGEEAPTPPSKRTTALVAAHIDHLERERPPGWLGQSTACLTAAYDQLLAVEAHAAALAGELPRSGPILGRRMLDTAVVSFAAGQQFDDVRRSASTEPVFSGVTRTFFFESTPRGLRLVAVEGNACLPSPPFRRV